MAEEAKSPVIEIDRGSWRLPLKFYVPDDVIAFLDREESAWAWFNDVSAGKTPASYKGRYFGWVQPFRDAATNWKNGGDPNQVRTLLQGRYEKARLLTADDIAAISICALGNVHPRAASVALTIFHGDEHQIEVGLFHREEDFRVGKAKAYAILAGSNPEVIAGAGNAFQKSRSDFDEEIKNVRSRISKFDESRDQTVAAATTEFEAAQQRFGGEFSTRRDQWESEFVSLKSGLEGLTAAYETRMQLEGPVRYWRGKSRNHRSSANKSFWALLIFSASAAIGLYYLFDHVSSFLPAPGKEISYATLFKIGAFSLLATTVVFWIGRVLLKIYLSDRHLATDAEERMTMIMTFLALVKKQVVKDEDRALILSALFRPGSDGIVKDDTAPDTAFAAILGNLIKR